MGISFFFHNTDESRGIWSLFYGLPDFLRLLVLPGMTGESTTVILDVFEGFKFHLCNF